MGAKTPKTAQELFKDIMSFIEMNQQKLTSGEDIDLQGMDMKIEGLCKEVQNLSVDEAMKYKPQLENLFLELSNLGNKMIQYHSALKKEISNISLRHKASVAYAKSDMYDTKKNEG